jgi:hypothetical protein
MKRFLCIFSLFMAVTIGLSAQDQITAISVSGLKLTKPRIVEWPLQKFIGKDAGSIDVNEVYSIIQSTGVVEPLSVEMADNQDGSGKTMIVTVRDKWSFIPIPIVTVNSGGWGAGGVVLWTNAFGVKDTMMAVGMYSPGDLMVSLMYINTPDGVGDFGWNVSGMFTMRENTDKDQAGTQILRSYKSMVINPSAGISYQLSELLTPGIGLAYKYIMLRDSDNPVNAPENNVHGITFSPNINIHWPGIWDGYFLNEKQISVKYDYTLAIDETDEHSISNIHSVSLTAAFNHSFIPGFRVFANSGIVFATPSASPFFASTEINAAVNILSPKYTAVNFAGLSLGLEKSLFKFKFGTLAISAAYQAVYSHGDLLTHQFDHGPVAMLLLYLNRVALPGVGLGGAYNVARNAWQYAVNVGVTF